MDKDIRQARMTFVELSKDDNADGDDDRKRKIELVGSKVFELIAQRHAYCTRAFESLWGLRRIDYSIAWRDIYRLNGRLPALAKRLDFEDAIRSNDFVMVVGATGSGKSTQIPQYLHDMPEFRGKKVYCTQPRRIATINLAERVAVEFAGGYEPQGKVGRKVGFQIGGLSNRSRHTMIEYMTEGMLVQHLADRLSRDKADENDKERITLRDAAAVVVDEVHERNIISDFLLGLLKEKKREYPNLKVIVSSATIDNKNFSDYFGNCPILEIPGKTFPVKVEYLPHPFHSVFNIQRNLLVSAVRAKALEILDTTTTGHVLCFMTGQGEVELARDSFLSELLSKPGKRETTIVRALFGKQTPDIQTEVVRPCPGKRKVIFATDVAETSLTVDGVQYVIDCGYSKDVVYDSKRNVTSLQVFPISRSSADQRAGRAGRTGPGTCIRLCSKNFYDKMEPYPKPEIQRRSLALTVTTLVGIGKNPYEFEWIDSPDENAIRAAEKELRLLGIITGPINGANVTDVGRAICSLQIDPSLGRMIYFACKDGFGLAAITIVAILTSNFTMFPTNCSKYLTNKGDVVSSYRAFCDWLELKDKDDQEQAQKMAEEKAKQAQENVIVDESGSNQAESQPAEAVTEVATVEEEQKFDMNDETAENGFEMLLPDEIGDAEDLPMDNELVQDSMTTSDRIREWAQRNSVSSDACYMAYLEQKNLLQRLEVRGIWKMSPKQDRSPSDEEIQKMALVALAMNIARLQSAPFWHYRVVTTDTIGEVWKRSLFRSVTAKAPQWIVFHEASQQSDGTRLALLHRVTPIEPKWVFETDQKTKFPKDFQNLVADKADLPLADDVVTIIGDRMVVDLSQE